MVLKIGNIVSHTGVAEWGSGKVMEVNTNWVMIQFSDGKARKIAASHFPILEAASASTYVPPPEAIASPRRRSAPKAPGKKKAAAEARK